MKRMKLTKSKLNRLIKEELQILLNEGHGGAYEDDPLFQHGVDEEYGSMETPGDLSSSIDVKDIPRYLEDMGYMIVPAEDFEMTPEQNVDYEAAEQRPDSWDMTRGGHGGFTGGMGR